MPQQPLHQGRPQSAPRPPNRAPSAGLHYPVPADTRAALEKFRTDGKQCRNFGLLFDRYIGYLTGWQLDKAKKPALEQIRDTHVENELLDAYKVRWRKTVADAKILEAQPTWRFITGLGRKGPLEVGFTFHPLYGLPFIPGSGLKGMTRAYAELVKHALPDELARVFGSPDQRGDAIFFDAIPAAPPTLELDVMNPHYPKYYQGDEPPANWQSPQPVFFLTLGANNKFWFAVGGAEKEIAAEWLREALVDLGAGAKTSAGYGYWQVQT